MKKRSLLLILALSASTLGLSGCSNNAQTGAVIGSLVGAGIGKSTSNHRDKRAAIGAVLGGIVGASVGQERDRAIAANNGYSNVPIATTRPYTNGNSANHSHGNRAHSHPGGSGAHAHNNGPTSSNTTVQHTTNTEYVYVDRPVYPVTSSVVIGSGYYHYPKRRFHRHRGFRHHHHRGHRGHHHRGHRVRRH